MNKVTEENIKNSKKQQGKMGAYALKDKKLYLINRSNIPEIGGQSFKIIISQIKCLYLSRLLFRRCNHANNDVPD